MFWKAQQVSAPISKDSAHATPEQFAKAIEAFGYVIKEAPGTVWAARAQVSIGSLYLLQKQYAKAREAYALVLQNHNQHQDLVLRSRVATAKTYEVEQHWDEAVKVYHEISDYHPWSETGLEAPLYIAVHYQKEGRPDEATQANERALRMYTQLLPNAPTPDAAILVKGYLAQAYQRLGQWDQAIKTLEELLNTPRGVNRPLALLRLGYIYQTKVDSPKKADALYRQLIQEFPEHPFVKIANVQLEQLSFNVAPRTP